MNARKLVKLCRRYARTIFNDPNKDMNYHDGCHMELAQLPRIQILGENVSGIHGICIPEFGRENEIAEYDGNLDERRLALYQAMKTPAMWSIAKAVYACGALTLRGSNPLLVAIAQYKSMKGINK